MSKYDSLKYLKSTKARIAHVCDWCGQTIAPGVTYFRETLPTKKPPNVKLNGYCLDCYEKYGTNLINMPRSH